MGCMCNSTEGQWLVDQIKGQSYEAHIHIKETRKPSRPKGVENDASARPPI